MSIEVGCRQVKYRQQRNLASILTGPYQVRETTGIVAPLRIHAHHISDLTDRVALASRVG